ncbi:MAG: nucleotidyltransferase domain-containing protein [Archaeoglobaceae archaeon]
MRTKIEEAIGKIRGLEGFDKVQFVILYGSAVRGGMTKESDIDLCIYYEGNPKEALEYRFKVLSELCEGLDVQIFQLLPLYVRIEVLKGEVIYCKNSRFLYETAISTIKDFEEFKPRFYDYIGEKAIT